MSPFIRQSLSRPVLKALVKGDSKLDYNKALGNVTALYRSALGGSASEVQIPLPADEKPRVKPGELTDVEMEQAIVGLFDYFDANLNTLNTYLGDSTKEMVMTRLWKEILATIEGLLIPPLSEAPSDLVPLTDKEVDIVFKWLKVCIFFQSSVDGQSITFPPVLTRLLLCWRRRSRSTRKPYKPEIPRYRLDSVVLRLGYVGPLHLDSCALGLTSSRPPRDMLMEECVRMMQQTLRAAPSIKKRAKSVYSQRNLGTIKNRKREKKEEKEVSNGETIMRILRMRYVV
jgi:hypothetical protein